MHCAKALIRSDFWKAEPRDDAPAATDAFVAASRFMALATIDLAGGADLSPKGDPAGRLPSGQTAAGQDNRKDTAASVRRRL